MRLSRSLSPGPIMVFIVLVMAIWTAGFVGTESSASPLDCEQIHDSDLRHLCRARTRHDPSECEFIKDSDTREECRAETKKP